MKHFSYCSLKPALSYISVNLCQITPVRPVELLRIYTGVILSRVWPFVDIDMHSIYCTITLQAGMQAHPLGKEKYKSQLQVISYPFSQACCISKSKLTGRTNQLELLGNNYARPLQLQPFARQSEVSAPRISFHTLSPYPAAGSTLIRAVMAGTGKLFLSWAFMASCYICVWMNDSNCRCIQRGILCLSWHLW